MRTLRLIAALLILALYGCAAQAESGGKGGRGGGHGGGDASALKEGIALMTGDGVEQDHAAAMECILAALEQGNRKAARYVGMMYEQGLGVAQDAEKAVALYREAAGYGNADAQAALERLGVDGTE